MKFAQPATNRAAMVQQSLQQATHLHGQNRLDEAEIQYTAALRADPNHTGAKHLLGLLRYQQGRHNDAIKLIKQVLSTQSHLPAAHANLGNALKAAGRPQEALSSYNTAIKQKPDYVDAIIYRGIVLSELGRHDEAISDYNRALAMAPTSQEALYNRGLVFSILDRLDEALVSYDGVLALNPQHVEALNNKGGALRNLKRYDEALVCFEAAIAVRPNHIEAHNNRGNVLGDLDRNVEALAAFDHAISLNPNHVGSLNNRGILLHKIGQHDAAIASLDRGLSVSPHNANGRLGRASIALALGDFTTGWRDYEYRIGQDGFPIRRVVLPCPVWSGQPLVGKKILVYDEQGFGDILQFARYLPLLAKQGADVSFLVNPKLHRILRPLTSSNVEMIADEPTRGFAYKAALMSLPYLLKTTIETTPADIPYLAAEPDRVAMWKDRISDDGVKIGIAWQGTPGSLIDIGRSFALRNFEQIAALPNVRLISLQKNHGLDQLAALPNGMRVETLGDDFDNGPDAFVDTAAVMANLDLVITSDTSIAHLAGALGRPVWVALKYIPDWRWMLDRADSPWYPSMKLHRQTTRGDWGSVFEKIAEDLATFEPDPDHGTLAP